MILDASEGQRECRIAEVGNQVLVRLEGDRCGLPRAPSHTSRPMHGRIGIKQQVVVGRNRITGKGATAQRSEERACSGNSCPAPPL